MKIKILQITLYIMIISLASCCIGIKKSQEFKIALKELTYHDYAHNFVIVPKHQLKEKRVLIYNNDTINIMNESTRTLVFKNIVSKNIIIYKFYSKDYYKRIDCDSSLQIIGITESLGKVY
jgi:hypothetical protein